MKKLIAIGLMLLFVVLSIAQTNVMTQPRKFDWIRIHPSSGTWATMTESNGRDTCDIYPSIDFWAGTTTLWFVTDTTVSGATLVGHDSCMTVYLELYNSYTGTWGVHYEGSTYALAARLDTVDSDLVNATESNWYMILPDLEEYTWATKARIWFQIGVDDSIRTQVFIGGQ